MPSTVAEQAIPPSFEGSSNVDGQEYEDHGKKSVAGWDYEYGQAARRLHLVTEIDLVGLT